MKVWLKAFFLWICLSRRSLACPLPRFPPPLLVMPVAGPDPDACSQFAIPCSRVQAVSRSYDKKTHIHAMPLERRRREGERESHRVSHTLTSRVVYHARFNGYNACRVRSSPALDAASPFKRAIQWPSS